MPAKGRREGIKKPGKRELSNYTGEDDQGNMPPLL